MDTYGGLVNTLNMSLGADGLMQTVATVGSSENVRCY